MTRLRVLVAAVAVSLAGTAVASAADDRADGAGKAVVYKTVFKGVEFDNGFSGRVRAKGSGGAAGFQCRSRDLVVRKITGKGKDKTKTLVAAKPSSGSGFFQVNKQNEVQGSPAFGPGRYLIVAKRSAGTFNKVSYRCRKGKSGVIRVANSG